MYVQHESQRECVCVRGHACVCVCASGLCQSGRATQTGFLQAVQDFQAGGMNAGSIPGSFAAPSQRQLVLVGRKIKDGQLARVGKIKAREEKEVVGHSIASSS